MEKLCYVGTFEGLIHSPKLAEGEELCGEHKHFPQRQKALPSVLTSHHVTQQDGAGGADKNIQCNPTALQRQLIMRVSFVINKHKDPPTCNLSFKYVSSLGTPVKPNSISFLKYQHFNIVYRIVQKE